MVELDDLPGSIWLVRVLPLLAGEELIAMKPDLLAALRTGEQVLAEWSPWPSGATRTASVYLDGFAAAYDECVA